MRDPQTNEIALEADEYPRASTTIEALSSLEPAFAALGAAVAGPDGETFDQMVLKKYPEAGEVKHLHTAGNSSGIVDGAASVLLASEDFVKAHGLKAGRVLSSMATAGAEPMIMLTAPTPASQKALAQRRMTASDIDLWEINEAFATVPLQVIRKLDIDPEKVNVNGGSIALGHPLGATGAISLARRSMSSKGADLELRSSHFALAAARASLRSLRGCDRRESAEC